MTLSPHSNVAGSNASQMYLFIVIFFLCLCGFNVGSLISIHSPQTSIKVNWGLGVSVVWCGVVCMMDWRPAQGEISALALQYVHWRWVPGDPCYTVKCNQLR